MSQPFLSRRLIFICSGLVLAGCTTSEPREPTAAEPAGSSSVATVSTARSGPLGGQWRVSEMTRATSWGS